MIAYFSGTGNSRYAAQRLAAQLGDSLLCLNDRIRADDFRPVCVDGRLVIVTPTYAWRIPRVVQHWLLKTELQGVKQVWFVMTCGSEIGNAARYNRALCAKKGFVCMGTAGIVMPENYIAMFSAPDEKRAHTIVTRAQPVIDCLAACIRDAQTFSAPRLTLSDRLMSGPVNPIFYSFYVKAKAFIVSDACVGCGKCAKLCPLHNITLQAGKPVWGSRCTHCMACICYCPVEAIEYGTKSLGQPRYRIETALAAEAHGGD